MPRYFFHIADGVIDPDDTGIELPSDDTARMEAIRFIGAAVEDDPRLLDEHERFCVIVASEGGDTLFKVCTQVMDPVAIKMPAADRLNT